MSDKPLLERVIDQSVKDHGCLVPSPPMPKNMMVELSNACNHACIFCTSPHMTRKKQRIDSGLLLRVMQEAHAEGVTEIGFYTTGDPFVHKDLAVFTKQASDIGFSYIYISTNGALATPERAKAVIDAGMDSIKFSINAASRDSYKAVHGKDDWDKVLAHLKYISEYRQTLNRPLKLFATCVITTLIEDELDRYTELLDPLVDEIVFSQVGTQSAQMASAFNLLKPVDESMHSATMNPICLMPFNRIHVTCEGYLTMCCVDYQNYLALVDLAEMSLLDAWRHKLFCEFRSRHLEQDIAGTLCGNCWLGRKDHIEPLNPAYATTWTAEEIGKSAAELINQRHDNTT